MQSRRSTQVSAAPLDFYSYRNILTVPRSSEGAVMRRRDGGAGCGARGRGFAHHALGRRRGSPGGTTTPRGRSADGRAIDTIARREARPRRPESAATERRKARRGLSSLRHRPRTVAPPGAPSPSDLAPGEQGRQAPPAPFKQPGGRSVGCLTDESEMRWRMRARHSRFPSPPVGEGGEPER